MKQYANALAFNEWSQEWCQTCKVDYASCPIVTGILLHGHHRHVRLGPPVVGLICTQYAPATVSNASLGTFPPTRS